MFIYYSVNTTTNNFNYTMQNYGMSVPEDLLIHLHHLIHTYSYFVEIIVFFKTDFQLYTTFNTL